jgi:bifunctional DNA-binding transcriptional regulator/antitoxin component of YhaV-PrlF toxin-antitoxin module
MDIILDNKLVTSKLTTKSQATIPEKIRKVLGLHPGDSVAFEIFESGNHRKVMIRKATQVDVEFARAVEGTLSEWLSTNDEEAYSEL